MEIANQNIDILSNDETVQQIAWEAVKDAYTNPTALLVSDQIIQKRTNICLGCEKYDKETNTCTVTNVDIGAKNRIAIESCPIGKWPEEKEYWINTEYKKIIERLKS